MNMASIGATCLGITVGWLVRFFLLRYEQFDDKTLGATISILVGTGGGVIGFFGLVDPNKSVIWFYPVGLLVGFLIYSITATLAGAPRRGGMYYSRRQEDSEEDPKS